MTANDPPLARVIDAHIHLWDLAHIHYPWLTPPFHDGGPNGNVSSIARTYLLSDYLDDAANWPVEGMVHVDAGATPEAALDETTWLQRIANRHPDLGFAIVAYAALETPGVEALLAAHCEHVNVRGIRQILNWHSDPDLTYTPADLLESDAWRRGFGLLGRFGLSFDLQIYPSQMPAAAKLAAAHPGTTLILNHAGMPVDRSVDGLRLWSSGMAQLAAQPNVAVKISGLGIADHGWTEESIRPIVLETIDHFGVDRCMFASDVPTDKLYAGFDRILGSFNRITANFTSDERDALFAANTQSIYRLGGRHT